MSHAPELSAFRDPHASPRRHRLALIIGLVVLILSAAAAWVLPQRELAPLGIVLGMEGTANTQGDGRP